MYVRWLGAFRKQNAADYGLSDVIDFEMTRTTPVACEKLAGKRNGKSAIRTHCKVGLIVSPSAVYRRYENDVFSEYSENGQLFPTRSQFGKGHGEKECFANPQFTGIVIRNASFNTLQKCSRVSITAAAKRYNLPVYRLVKGRLIEESI